MNAIPNICVCSAARQASRSLTRLYDLLLRPTGLRMSQYVLLREIGAAGEIPQWQLSERLSVAVETLSRRLAMLKQRGWVEVKIGSRRRERIYSLTAAGRARQKAAEPYWGRAQHRLADVMGDAQWSELLRLLQAVPVMSERAARKRAPNGSAKAGIGSAA